MWQKLQRLLDRLESRISLWQLLRGSGVLTAGVLSGIFSAGVQLLDRFGPFGWWVAFLIGCVLAAFAMWLVGSFRLKFATAAAMNKWQARVDAINPVAPEFHKQRVRLSDLTHPVTNSIEDKKLTDCDILGPANVALVSHVELNGVNFLACDFVVLRLKRRVYNVIKLNNVKIRGGTMSMVTLFIPPDMVDDLAKAPGFKFATLTGNAIIDADDDE